MAAIPICAASQSRIYLPRICLVYIMNYRNYRDFGNYRNYRNYIDFRNYNRDFGNYRNYIYFRNYTVCLTVKKKLPKSLSFFVIFIKN